MSTQGPAPADAAGAMPAELTEYALVAGAVAGRQVALGPAKDLPYTDGSTIYVPNRRPSRDAVLVQAALIGQGSLVEPGLRATLRSGPDGPARYLVLEAARAADSPWLLPPAVRARIRAVYDGPVACSARDSAARAAGRERLPEPPWWFGQVSLRALKAASGPAPARAPKEAAAAVPPAVEPEDGAEDGEDSGTSGEESSRILRALTTPGGRPLPRAVGKLLGGRSKAGLNESADGTEFAVSGARASREASAGGRLRRGIVALFSPAVGPTVFGRSYPEWDAYSGMYRANWCTVQEFDPVTRADAPTLRASPDHQLRRELARLATTTRRRRHLLDGDCLDTTALVDVEVDRRLGEEAEPRIFEARLRTGRDLGVLILLDATGSTAELAEGPTVFDEQRLMVHQLTTCLEELGDRVAVHAFYSRGRDAVRFLRIKDFDARYDRAAQGRLAGLEPAGFTRLGAAVRHATGVLSRAAGTANLALTVVGDGLPYDDGYEDRYAREDTRAALREALAAGVGCVSLGIRSSVPQSVLDDVWGEVTAVNLERAEELRQVIRPALGSAIRLAASRRRAPGGGMHR